MHTRYGNDVCKSCDVHRGIELIVLIIIVLIPCKQRLHKRRGIVRKEPAYLVMQGISYYLRKIQERSCPPAGLFYLFRCIAAQIHAL